MPFEHAHYGIYASIIQAGKILLVHKKRGPYAGKLDLPGGSPEHNETTKQTLIREVTEETGATISAIHTETPFIVNYTYENQGQKCVLTHSGLIFSVDIRNTPIKSTHSSDTAGCTWIPLDDIHAQNITPTVLKALSE